MQESVRNLIGKGYSTWKKNPDISAPLVLGAVIDIALILLFAAVSYFIFGIGASDSNTSGSSVYTILFIPIFILFIILLLSIYSFFQSGMIEMAREATAEGKTKISSMWSAGRRQYKHMFLSNILILLIWIGAGLVVIVPFLLAKLNPSLSGLISGLGILFALVVLLIVYLATSLVPYALIVDNIRPVEAVKASFGFFRSHLLDVLLMSVVFLIISMIISLIGDLMKFGGSQVLIALWMPIQFFCDIFVFSLAVVCFTRLYMDRTGKQLFGMENGT